MDLFLTCCQGKQEAKRSEGMDFFQTYRRENRETKRPEGMDLFQTKQLLPGFDTNGRSGRKTGDDNRKRYF